MKFFGGILLAWSLCCTASGSEIVCGEQGFLGHLQGIATDDTGIYWSFSNSVVKTDYTGKKIASVSVPPHAGDLCAANGQIHVSVCYCRKADIRRDGGTGWIYVYDDKLKFQRKIALPNTPRPDGITFCNGLFYVAGDDFGKKPHPLNVVRVYSSDWQFRRLIEVNIGKPTNHGAQTLNAVGGRILAGFYTKEPNSVFLSMPNLKTAKMVSPSVACGFAVMPKKFSGDRELYMVGNSTGSGKDRTRGGKIVIYEMRGGRFLPADWKLP